MKKLLATTILCSAFALPAFAQDDTTTCADFTAMDATAQTEALASIESGMDGMGAGADVDTEATASVEEGSTDDSASASGTASEDMAADATDDSSGGAAADIGAEVTAQAVLDACADNPDMLVTDAIEQAKSN